MAKLGYEDGDKSQSQGSDDEDDDVDLDEMAQGLPLKVCYVPFHHPPSLHRATAFSAILPLLRFSSVSLFPVRFEQLSPRVWCLIVGASMCGRECVCVWEREREREERKDREG